VDFIWARPLFVQICIVSLNRRRSAKCSLPLLCPLGTAHTPAAAATKPGRHSLDTYAQTYALQQSSSGGCAQISRRTSRLSHRPTGALATPHRTSAGRPTRRRPGCSTGAAAAASIQNEIGGVVDELVKQVFVRRQSSY
jgi:hypothetical protein